MAENSTSDSRKRKPPQTLKVLLLIFVGGLLLTWLILTPPGLLGKSDAAAYAVCHRISSHSFYFGDRPFSLCARCSGQYLGFLWGFFLQVVLARKRAGFPGRWAVSGIVVMVLVYALDGLNSLFHLSPGLEAWSLYAPHNTLRLFTGLGMGLSISGIYYPLMGQTIWKDYDPGPALKGIRDYSLLIGGGIGIGLLVLSGNPLILYPLILLSTGGLMLLLTLLYTVIWILLKHRENSFGSWIDLTWWILAGFGSALFQIVLIDAIRFYATGTWSGFLDY
jgi:uncharacterized membrane protein